MMPKLVAVELVVVELVIVELATTGLGLWGIRASTVARARRAALSQRTSVMMSPELEESLDRKQVGQNERTV